jgi:hypothetical protein
MDGQDDQSAYLDDLEYLDHLECLECLECLGDVMEGKMIKMIKVLNILMAGSLIILPISMRLANNSASARLARTSADVM